MSSQHLRAQDLDDDGEPIPRFVLGKPPEELEPANLQSGATLLREADSSSGIMAEAERVVREDEPTRRGRRRVLALAKGAAALGLVVSAVRVWRRSRARRAERLMSASRNLWHAIRSRRDALHLLS